MACCGASRTPLFGTAARPAQAASAAVGGLRYRIQFEYTGRTALTAIGPVSGRRYRFDRPGAIVVVDPRDRPSLAAVPNLRAV